MKNIILHEPLTRVWQKWRFYAPQTHLWLIKVWFYASTFVVKIATFAKPYASSVFYGIATVCNCHTFCVVFFPMLNSTLQSSFLRLQRAVPTLKNKAKRHFTPTTTTVPFMPVCKSVEVMFT